MKKPKARHVLDDDHATASRLAEFLDLANQQHQPSWAGRGLANLGQGHCATLLDCRLVFCSERFGDEQPIDQWFSPYRHGPCGFDKMAANMPPMPLTGPKRCPFGQSALMPKVMQAARASESLWVSFLTVPDLRPTGAAAVRDPQLRHGEIELQGSDPVRTIDLDGAPDQRAQPCQLIRGFIGLALRIMRPPLSGMRLTTN